MLYVAQVTRVSLWTPFIEFIGQALTSRTIKVRRASQGVAESQIGRGGVAKFGKDSRSFINIGQRSLFKKFYFHLLDVLQSYDVSQ